MNPNEDERASKRTSAHSLSSERGREIAKRWEVYETPKLKMFVLWCGIVCICACAFVCVYVCRFENVCVSIYMFNIKCMEKYRQTYYFLSEKWNIQRNTIATMILVLNEMRIDFIEISFCFIIVFWSLKFWIPNASNNSKLISKWRINAESNSLNDHKSYLENQLFDDEMINGGNLVSKTADPIWEWQQGNKTTDVCIPAHNY